MATVPVTGLTALGNVLANFGQTYAANARQDQLQARARQLQLEDREAARQEGDRQFERSRAAQLDDRQAANQRADELYQRQRGDQLDDRDDQRIWAEAAAVRERARALAERLPFETNLQSAVDDAAQQLTGVRSRIEEVQRRVNAPVPTVSPNDPEVQARVQQLTNGSRNREEIAAVLPKAIEEVQASAFIRHQISVKSAQEVLQSLKTSETQLTNLIQSGIQARVAPKMQPPSTGEDRAGLRTLSDAPAQPRAATAADIAAAVNQALGVQQTSGSGSVPQAASRSQQLFDNPTNNPAIAAGNAELAARRPAMLQAELNNVTRQLGDVTAQLEAPPPTMPTLGMGLGGYNVGSVADPVAGARNATALLQQRAALDAKRRDLEAQLRGPTVGGATPPAISTPTQSTPSVDFAAPGTRWWEAPPMAR